MNIIKNFIEQKKEKQEHNKILKLFRFFPEDILNYNYFDENEIENIKNWYSNQVNKNKYPVISYVIRHYLIKLIGNSYLHDINKQNENFEKITKLLKYLLNNEADINYISKYSYGDKIPGLISNDRNVVKFTPLFDAIYIWYLNLDHDLKFSDNLQIIQNDASDYKKENLISLEEAEERKNNIINLKFELIKFLLENNADKNFKFRFSYYKGGLEEELNKLINDMIEYAKNPKSYTTDYAAGIAHQYSYNDRNRINPFSLKILENLKKIFD